MTERQITLFEAEPEPQAEPGEDVSAIGETRIRQTMEWMVEEAACLGRVKLRKQLESYDDLTSTQRVQARMLALDLCSVRWGNKRIVP